MPRRACLKAAGVPCLGLAAVKRVLGGAGLAPDISATTPAAAARDPIAEPAAALDYDVERIFRFVADEVRYEPYAGVLGGARGTLAGRAGNSPDRALLLVSLLDASAVPVRFITGRLDETTQR